MMYAAVLSVSTRWMEILKRFLMRECGTAGDMVDIQGVCKSTVVRGEEDFPSGTLRVTDCHDTVIYALAPLQ